MREPVSIATRDFRLTLDRRRATVTGSSQAAQGSNDRRDGGRRDRTGFASGSAIPLCPKLCPPTLLFLEIVRPAESASSGARWRIFGLPMGKPQMIAGGLLALFLAQCFWFAARTPLNRTEISYILQGNSQLEGGPPVPSPVHSPLPGLLGAALAPSSETARSSPRRVPRFARLARAG